MPTAAAAIGTCSVQVSPAGPVASPVPDDVNVNSHVTVPVTGQAFAPPVRSAEDRQRYWYPHGGCVLALMVPDGAAPRPSHVTAGTLSGEHGSSP